MSNQKDDIIQLPLLLLLKGQWPLRVALNPEPEPLDERSLNEVGGDEEALDEVHELRLVAGVRPKISCTVRLLLL